MFCYGDYIRFSILYMVLFNKYFYIYLFYVYHLLRTGFSLYPPTKGGRYGKQINRSFIYGNFSPGRMPCIYS